MNNYSSFMQAVSQFRQQFQGQNPDTMINQMLQNRRITQAQYNQARQAAEQIRKMIDPGAQGRS